MDADRHYIICILAEDGRTVVPLGIEDYDVWNEWMHWHHAERRVAKTMVGAARVSTVFLGQFLGFHGCCFETMVFLPDGQTYYQRALTWETAELLHTEMVADVAEMLGVKKPLIVWEHDQGADREEEGQE